MKRDKLKIGLPTAIQMVAVNISYLLITGMLKDYGVSVAAASGVGLKVNTFAGMPCWAIGQAITAMAGQNIGANDEIRHKKAKHGIQCLAFFVPSSRRLVHYRSKSCRDRRRDVLQKRRQGQNWILSYQHLEHGFLPEAFASSRVTCFGFFMLLQAEELW